MMCGQEYFVPNTSGMRVAPSYYRDHIECLYSSGILFLYILNDVGRDKDRV